MRLSSIVLALAVALVAAGCASSKGGDVYTRGQVREVQSVKTGTVLNSRIVQIEGTKSGIGDAAGAVVGGIAGATRGGGNGGAESQIAGVVGAVVGGVVGAAAEEGLTRTDGIELIIKLDDGPVISVVQGVSSKEEDNFKAGDKVYILENEGVTRVSRLKQQ